MPSKKHWEHVYASKLPETLSWFQERADRSLRLITETGVPHSGAIIDVGGGRSTLAEDLRRSGYSDLTVLDLSAAALDATKARLGAAANDIRWFEGDITQVTLPVETYDIWHDRAAFHFLIDEADRNAYVQTLLRSVKPGGHVIVATFAEDGPPRCSGLPVVRYSTQMLQAEFGPSLDLIGSEREQHRTPSGATQSFVYCRFRKASP
jgi:SAM-dependent methyltransferase